MTTISSPDDFAATDPVEVAMTRRRIFHAAGAVGAGVLLSGLAVDRAVAATSKKTTKKVAVSKAAACVPVRSGTGGPFPGNGTNGVNVLTEKGIVRRDIRPSFGSMTGVAAGVPLTINLLLRRASSGCAALPNAAVYIWHCDAIGQYSLYSIETENYLRGVQVADAKGALSFVTSFPGAYPGRWPHVHFKVYPSLKEATSANNEISYEATGSHRYRVTYKGPGGHSYNAFGLPSAIHALGRAIAGIADLQTPARPKTTFTVGTVSGGTSVNSIAGNAAMDVDMRSESADELDRLDAAVRSAVAAAVRAENARWRQ